MSEQTEDKVKVDIWPRRPGKSAFSSNLSRDDFDQLYLCRPHPEPEGPKVTFENYRARHKRIDYLCDILEEVFSRTAKIGNAEAFHRAFRLRKRLEDEAWKLGCHGDVLIDLYNPDLMQRELIKWTIQKRDKSVFIGIDLADSPDRTERMTFTPQTPPVKVVIKAVIT